MQQNSEVDVNVLVNLYHTKLAAALNQYKKIDSDALIIVCTGGNVDPVIFSKALDLIDAKY